MTRYIRLKTISIDTVIDAINSGKRIKGTNGAGVSSLRLKTFAKCGTSCAYCGLEATYFAVECSKGSKIDKAHLNLWGMQDGKEVLFTHDHIHARALGGADVIENAITACENCNSKKSKYENRLLQELNKLKISVDFDGLAELVKSIWKENHIRKFWFIEV